MVVAQQLYEGLKVQDGVQGLITYMRTDATRVSDEAISDVRKLIKDKYGSDFLPQNQGLIVPSLTPKRLMKLLD